MYGDKYSQLPHPKIRLVFCKRRSSARLRCVFVIAKEFCGSPTCAKKIKNIVIIIIIKEHSM